MDCKLAWQNRFRPNQLILLNTTREDLNLAWEFNFQILSYILYHVLSHMRHIIKRGKWFHFKRRIPNLYSHYYDDDVIQFSLKTDSENVAIQHASILNNELEKIWSQLPEQGQSENDNLFERAVTIARMSGFGYRPAAEIAEQNRGRILSRIDTVKNEV